MLARIDFPVMPDQPGIGRVGQDVIEMPAFERAAAAGPARRGYPTPRAQSQPADLLLHCPDCAMFPVEPVQRPHGFREIGSWTKGLEAAIWRFTHQLKKILHAMIW